MILSRLFNPIKPKWQSANPAVRKQAVQELTAADPILQQLAQEDQDPEVRRSALAKINDLTLLTLRASIDPAAEVRDYVHNRLAVLLSGQASDAPNLEQRLRLLEQSATTELLQQLVRDGAEPELRLAALQRLNQEALYAERAVQDPAAQVRLQALAQVHSLPLLEQVARESRKRDKRISRTARERFESARQEQQRQQQIEELCDAMETLRWDGETGPNAVRFAKLDEAWLGLAEFAPETMRARFQKAREAFNTNFKTSAARRHARLDLLQRVQARLQELQQLEQYDPEDSGLQTFLTDARTEWDALGPADDAEARRLQRDFEQVCGQLHEQWRKLGQHFAQSRRMRLTLADAEHLLQRSGQVLDSDVTELEQRWRHLPRLEAKALQTELEQQFERILSQLRARLQRQAERKEQEQEALQTSMDELEQALNEGELQQALDLQKKIKELLEHNISLSRRQISQVEHRLQAAAGVIGQLNGWRRWGTNQAREHLIENVEQLLEQNLAPAELARQVQAARMAWKEMDSGGVAPRALWKRFDTACERAYEPCRAYFQEQAALRQQHLAERQSLCDDLQQWLEQTDWSSSSVDWREVSSRIQKTQQQWRQIGAVNRAERRAIEKRYQGLLQQVQGKLQPQIEQELARRAALIERARQLAELEDVHAAIEEIKQLQVDWKPRVLAARRREQRLWKEFRAACDAVFARRQAAQEAQQVERESNLAQREAAVAAIQELAALHGTELMQAQAQYQQLREQWEHTGPVPRNAQAANERAYKAACAAFEQALQQQRQREENAQLEALGQRAQICQQLEALLTAPAAEVSAALEAACSAWQQLPPVKPALSKQIEARFAQLCEALQADSEEARQALVQSLQAQQAQKRQLCLRMEIAARLESPPEFAQERMQYQVARLSQSLTERSARPTAENSTAEAQAAAEEWFLTGALGDEQAQALEQRFNKAYETVFGAS